MLLPVLEYSLVAAIVIFMVYGHVAASKLTKNMRGTTRPERRYRYETYVNTLFTWWRNKKDSQEE